MSHWIRALTAGAVLLAGISKSSGEDLGKPPVPKNKSSDMRLKGGGLTLGKADLLISNLVVVQPNANYLKVYVKNAGNRTAKNFIVRVTFRGDKFAPLEQTVVECKVGDVQTAHFHWSGDFDKQDYWVTVDAGETVFESNEANNKRFVRAKPLPPAPSK